VEISIFEAGPEHAETVADILADAARWLAERGIALWQAAEINAERIREENNSGLYLLATVSGRPAGTIRYQQEDPRFWPDTDDDAAAYIHRLTVTREFAGGSVSAALLEATMQLARDKKHPFLRTACETSRAGLIAFYERHEFFHHSDYDSSGYRVGRYQRRVAPPP